MTRTANRATYSNTSAILSAIFSDAHSAQASGYARSDGFHFETSLGWAEAHAVMSRIEREGALSRTLVDPAQATLEAGPWRRINVGPSRNALASLARKWPLRGADLWHLATAKELQADVAELALLSFDQRLNAAAAGEGLIHESRS